MPRSGMVIKRPSGLHLVAMLVGGGDSNAFRHYRFDHRGCHLSGFGGRFTRQLLVVLLGEGFGTPWHQIGYQVVLDA